MLHPAETQWNPTFLRCPRRWRSEVGFRCVCVCIWRQVGFHSIWNTDTFLFVPLYLGETPKQKHLREYGTLNWHLWCVQQKNHRCQSKKNDSWHRRLGRTDTSKAWKAIEKPSRSLSVMSNKNRVKPNAFVSKYPRRCWYEVGFHYVLEYIGRILTLRCVWRPNIWRLNTVLPGGNTQAKTPTGRYGFFLNWHLWCGLEPHRTSTKNHHLIKQKRRGSNHKPHPTFIVSY